MKNSSFPDNYRLIDYKEYGDCTNIFYGEYECYDNYIKLIHHIHRLSLHNSWIPYNLEESNNPNLKEYDIMCILEKYNKNSEFYVSEKSLYQSFAYYIPIENDIIALRNQNENDITFTFDESLEKVLKESQEIPEDIYNCKNLHIFGTPYININGKVYKRFNPYNTIHIEMHIPNSYVERLFCVFGKYRLSKSFNYVRYQDNIYKDEGEIVDN
jgi:hypothetical protein